MINETTLLPVFRKIDNASRENLRKHFYKLAVRYANTRAEWNFMTVEEKAVEDAARSRLHNALIDSLNILTRQMEKDGEDTSWRSIMGNDRKIIGDFACYVAAWLGIRQR